MQVFCAFKNTTNLSSRSLPKQGHRLFSHSWSNPKWRIYNIHCFTLSQDLYVILKHIKFLLCKYFVLFVFLPVHYQTRATNFFHTLGSNPKWRICKANFFNCDIRQVTKRTFTCYFITL